MDSGRAQHVSGNDSPAATTDVLFDFAGVLVDWRPWLAFGYDSQEALDEAVGEGKPGAAAVQRFPQLPVQRRILRPSHDHSLYRYIPQSAKNILRGNATPCRAAGKRLIV